LLAAVSLDEILIGGFGNRDLQFAELTDKTDRRRQAGKESRLPKAYGLIKKIPRKQRYLLTSEGTKHVPPLLALRDTSLQRLTAAQNPRGRTTPSALTTQ
jgi:hypothetical protein